MSLESKSSTTLTSQESMKNANSLKVKVEGKLNLKIKEKDKIKNLKSENKQDISSVYTAASFLPPVVGDPCPCASLIPNCCTPEFESFNCNCIAKPDCGMCPADNLNVFSNFHDTMLRLAMKDAFNQQDMAQKAKLQVELFQKAQNFAKEVGIQEMKAKQYAKILNEATRKAQISRAMMFQAASQVRLLADKTLRAISPMRCNGPRCGAMINQNFIPAPTAFNNPGIISGPVDGVQQHLYEIKQKLNTLEQLNSPVVVGGGNMMNGYGPLSNGVFNYK